MKIEFEMIDKEEVAIIGVVGESRKKLGHIFTPSGSGRTNFNAIQICGFEEAFDFWGCGIFGEETIEKKKLTTLQRSQIKKFSKNPFMKEHYGNALKRGYLEEPNVVMKKDIQLMFKMYDKESDRFGDRNCWACYNNPCTCENKGNHKNINPFIVKRESQLKSKLEKTT